MAPSGACGFSYRPPHHIHAGETLDYIFPPQFVVLSSSPLTFIPLLLPSAHTHRSPPAKEFGQTKGKVAIPTGADGGKLNIYSFDVYEKAQAEADLAAAKLHGVKSLAGGGGRAHVSQPNRPTPFGQGGAYNLPEREVAQYDHGSNSTYHPGMKFAAPARKVHLEAAPDNGIYRNAYEFNQERKKDLLRMAHPLVKGNGDILGHDGAALFNKHMVGLRTR
jgi:hypothetical protein